MSVLEHEHDIYRGEPPQPQSLYTEPSIISTSSSSESASTRLAASRLGAIAAKVELAISRWARNVRGNSSSTSDSSSSPSSSSSSLPKSQRSRRSRRPSLSSASLRTLQSGREIAARISRMKALEEVRRIPRQFTLYLPPSISHKSPPNQPGLENKNRQPTHHSPISSTSLPLVLKQFGLAIRKTARNRRLRQRHRSLVGNPPSLDFASHTEDNQSSWVYPPAPRGRKGKHRESPTRAKSPLVTEEPKQAWFLDVANPTWADLRAIGKLLHIHPLTLEDILQQDPREKLELFTNLGYYFISFRAIESSATKERLQHEAVASGNNWSLDESSLGEANAYLTVFDDGICCFHFTDVSEHIDRVRNKMFLFQQVVNMSSDWIAHDILDSVVDSFFPFLENIQREAMAFDKTLFFDNCLSRNLNPIIIPEPPKPPKATSIISGLSQRRVPTRIDTGSPLDEKCSDDQEPEDKKFPQPRFVVPGLTISLVIYRTRRFMTNIWNSCRTKKAEPPPTPSRLMLRRIGSTRKLVTSLVRLLATKSDVLTAFRKRLMRKAVLKAAGRSSDDLIIYSGDVQDHILTLQHSLIYYERLLSELNPTYISQLHAEISITKNKADINLLFLTTVTVGCAVTNIMIGIFSMNVQIPTNLHAPEGPHFWFIGIFCMIPIIFCVLVLFIRHWWKQSKRRRSAKLA